MEEILNLSFVFTVNDFKMCLLLLIILCMVFFLITKHKKQKEKDEQIMLQKKEIVDNSRNPVEIAQLFYQLKEIGQEAIVKNARYLIVEKHNFKLANDIIVLWQENEDFMSSLINGHVLNQKCKDDLDKNKICCISPSAHPATWNMFGAACVMHNIDITNKQGLNKECLVNFLILN